MRIKVSLSEFVRVAGGLGNAIALGAGSVAVLVSGAVGLARLHHRKTAYVPGEKIASVTESLARTLPAGCRPVRFKDATTAAGLNFVHFHGARSSQLPEDMGSGGAWGDYNSDGYPDLFLPNEAGPLTLSPAQVQSSPARCALYRNDGDGAFTNVTDAAGLGGLRGWFMGACWGDYDNDGHPDLFITAYGRNRLFHNNGNGTFTEVTARSGVGGLDGFWTGASWGDYDRDGYLDLYVCGYVKYHTPRGNESALLSKQNATTQPFTINPSSYPPERNLLYHNNGNGAFTEVADRAGVADRSGRSLSVTWCDFNGDGWPDLYVNNDVSMHAFYQNLGHGKFKDIGASSLACDYRGGMGIAIGDWDNNGDLDMFLGHWLGEEDALYDNTLTYRSRLKLKGGPSIQLLDIADQVGLGQSTIDYVSWGAAFLDVDNDGWPDLVIASGSTLQKDRDKKLLVPEKNQLFWNGGHDRGFFEIEDLASKSLAAANNGRGAAIADYDRDGRPDILITRNGGPPLLLHNVTRTANHWIELALQGTRSNRDAVGARLTILAGGTRQMREVGAGSSYLCQNDLVQTIGLGRAAYIDKLSVRWPSGLHQVFRHLASGQFLRIVEGQQPVPMKLTPTHPNPPHAGGWGVPKGRRS
ncbi:MAG TPA: CRTAC1 family protein [Armatimonadota bacterium]|nr:CRTAC1 family protein [Armatimonadota bacterium]